MIRRLSPGGCSHHGCSSLVALLKVLSILMKTLDEFKTYYQEELKDTIEKTHDEIDQIDGGEVPVTLFDRLQVFAVVAGGSGVIVGPIIYAASGGDLQQALMYPVLFGLFATFMGPKVAQSLYKGAQVQETIKENVASKIVSFFGEDFSLDPTGQIEKETINESLAFPRAAKVAYGEDRVIGTVGDTAVAFSEVILSRSSFAEVKEVGYTSSEEKEEAKEKMNHYRMSKMAASDNSHFFRGLYFVADFKKYFRGHTVVRPTDDDLDPEGRLETADGTALERMERVHLEDPELESLYNVYGTDQQQARYILSTSLMERIKGFRKRTGKSIYLAFCGSNMHLAVPYSRDLLELREPNSREELLAEAKGETTLDYNIREDRIFDYFKDLRFILGIVEEFDLNTRIWLKGEA